MDFFISPAYAQAASANETFLSLVPLVLIFVVFYFLLIRPQTKRQKEHKEMVEAITAGDEVATAGGLLGKVVGTTDDGFLRIELADNVVVTVQRHTIGAVLPKGTLRSAVKAAGKNGGKDKLLPGKAS